MTAVLRAEIARFCRITWDRGLVSAAGGNISARLNGRDEVLITPSGVALRDTTPDDLVTIDLDGRKLDGPEAATAQAAQAEQTAKNDGRD